MPTYVYKCPVHGELEIFHSMSETVKECPECAKIGNKTLVRQIIAGGSGFILQGTCWAKDGYRG